MNKARTWESASVIPKLERLSQSTRKVLGQKAYVRFYTGASTHRRQEFWNSFALLFLFNLHLLPIHLKEREKEFAIPFSFFFSFHLLPWGSKPKKRNFKFISLFPFHLSFLLWKENNDGELSALHCLIFLLCSSIERIDRKPLPWQAKCTCKDICRRLVCWTSPTKSGRTFRHRVICCIQHYSGQRQSRPKAGGSWFIIFLKGVGIKQRRRIYMAWRTSQLGTRSSIPSSLHPEYSCGTH